VEYCLRWKLWKGQAVAAGQVAVVAVLVLFPKWKELEMSVGYSLLVRYSNQSLVESLEVAVELEVLLEELYWRDSVLRLPLMGPVVEVLERRSNCIGTQGLCLLLQSRICRCPRFRKWSKVVFP
jgi:hypothetical protein